MKATINFSFTSHFKSVRQENSQESSKTQWKEHALKHAFCHLGLSGVKQATLGCLQRLPSRAHCFASLSNAPISKRHTAKQMRRLEADLFKMVETSTPQAHPAVPFSQKSCPQCVQVSDQRISPRTFLFSFFLCVLGVVKGQEATKLQTRLLNQRLCKY